MDTAIVRTFIDTGARLSEVASIKVADVDLDGQTITVTGKGDRVRVLPIGHKTVKAIDRYMRARVSRDADGLWIGGKGQMTPSGVAQMLRRRAAKAEIGGLNPHRFRHTFAHRWLSGGGQETDVWCTAVAEEQGSKVHGE